MHLHHHPFLARVPITNFGDSVAGSTNLEKDFSLHAALRGSNHKLCLLRITGSTTSKISLMFLPLRMGKIGTFVRVQSQTQTTFERAKVISQDVRILPRRVKPAEKHPSESQNTLARSMVSSASFLNRSRLSTFVSDAPATPPPPNLDPTRFYGRNLGKSGFNKICVQT